MKLLILAILPMALANIITANVLVPEATPTPKLFRRTDTTCLSSVLSELQAPKPSNLTSLSPRNIMSLSCTVTAPWTVSSPAISYVSVLKTYINTIETKVKAIKTDCGATNSRFTLAWQCPNAAVVLVFTDSSFNRTRTVGSTTIPLPNVATSIPIGDGAGILGPRVAAVLFAVFAAVLKILS